MSASLTVKESIKSAVDYLRRNQIEIPLDVLQKAHEYGILKAAGDITAINAKYHDAITNALTKFFEGSTIAGPRNTFRQATAEAFYDVFYLGWAESDGGAPDTDALAWLDSYIQQEYGNIETLFQQARELRKEEGFDWFEWVTARADGYTAALSAVYNAAKMLSKKSQMLTWRLGNTEKHCATCASLNGKSHRASWYISRNYIPRKPGAAMKCGGYYCDCTLVNKEGQEVTI